MRTDNFRRMSALALAIPTREYERKDASGAPNPSEIKDQILGQVTTVANDLKEIRRELEAVKAAGRDSPELKAELEKAVKRLDRIDSELQRPTPSKSAAAESFDPGAAFVKSDEFSAWKARGWHKGGAALHIKGKNILPGPGLKTITTASIDSPEPYVIPGIIDPLVRDLRIRDLMRVIPTEQTTIKFLKETGFTNAASPQVEAEAKGESDITFTDDTAEVKTIAHWIPATRQVLDDVPRLQDYINNRMMYGLKLKEEEQILAGDGTGENLDGLIGQATAYAGTIADAGDTEIDVILNAMTELRLAEAPVEGTVLNPTDWARIQKIKTEEGGANKGQYVFGNPGAAPFQVAMLWGRPVVITTAIVAGSFLVGAFRMFAELYDRQEAVIDISTEHSDFFVKNKVAIRAEERLALVVTRPEAFRYGAF